MGLWWTEGYRARRVRTKHRTKRWWATGATWILTILTLISAINAPEDVQKWLDRVFTEPARWGIRIAWVATAITWIVVSLDRLAKGGVRWWRRFCLRLCQWQTGLKSLARRMDSILCGVYIEYWAHQGPSISEDGELLSDPRDAESGRSIRLRVGRSTVINANQCAMSRKTRTTELPDHIASDEFKISFRVRGGGYLLSFSSEGYPFFPEESPEPGRMTPSGIGKWPDGSQYTLDFKGMDRAMEFRVTVTRYEGWFPRGPFALHAVDDPAKPLRSSESHHRTVGAQDGTDSSESAGSARSSGFASDLVDQPLKVLRALEDRQDGAGMLPAPGRGTASEGTGG